MFFRKLALILFKPRPKNTRQLQRKQQRNDRKDSTKRFKRVPVTAHLAARMQ